MRLRKTTSLFSVVGLVLALSACIPPGGEPPQLCASDEPNPPGPVITLGDGDVEYLAGCLTSSGDVDEYTLDMFTGGTVTLSCFGAAGVTFTAVGFETKSAECDPSLAQVIEVHPTSDDDDYVVITVEGEAGLPLNSDYEIRADFTAI